MIGDDHYFAVRPSLLDGNQSHQSVDTWVWQIEQHEVIGYLLHFEQGINAIADRPDPETFCHQQTGMTMTRHFVGVNNEAVDVLAHDDAP
jgi:hypothetical protein